MIEGRTAPVDPDIEQLVQRLLGSRERWYGRGREDGKRWAVSEATREQLYQVADQLAGEDVEELARASTAPPTTTCARNWAATTSRGGRPLGARRCG